MKTILTIALTFIVSVGMAQRNNTLIISDGISSTGSIKSWQVNAPVITIGETPRPIISLKGVKITGQDTSYTILEGKPMREVAYYYMESKKQMQVVKKDLYDGKNWIFYSVLVEPYSRNYGFINKGNYQLFNPNYK